MYFTNYDCEFLFVRSFKASRKSAGQVLQSAGCVLNGIIGVARGPGPPPIEMPPMIKMMTQSILFLLFQFLLAYFACNDTSVQQHLAIMLILTTKAPRTPQFKFFANQFKCTGPKKFSVFVVKVAISGPHLTFLRINSHDLGLPVNFYFAIT